MYKVFYGSNTKASHLAEKAEFEHAKKQYDGCLITKFDDSSLNIALAIENLSNISMFGGVNILIFNDILEHADGPQFYRMLAALRETVHVVLIRETAIPKDILEILENIGADITEYTIQSKIEPKKNNFVLADAIAGKDKKTAWVEFELSQKSGVVMEEIHGTIFWVFKNLLLVSTKTKEEAFAGGVKDFTYRKYQNFAKGYLSGEIENKLNELKEMYHRGHEHGDLNVRMEQFILSL